MDIPPRRSAPAAFSCDERVPSADCCVSIIKKTLESPFSQYLGCISYVMCIVHRARACHGILKDAVMGSAAMPGLGVGFTEDFVPMTPGDKPPYQDLSKARWLR
jgi:hypothetical protein